MNFTEEEFFEAAFQAAASRDPDWTRRESGDYHVSANARFKTPHALLQNFLSEMADAPDDGEDLTELLGWIPEDIRNRVGEYLARERRTVRPFSAWLGVPSTWAGGR